MAGSAPYFAALAPPHNRQRWALGAAAGLALLLGVALLLLDPWLRRTLEKQVAEKTHGQYTLRIQTLKTSLWHRSLTVQQVALRHTGPVADTLPQLALTLARLDLRGVGLWALLRRQVVPIDSLGLDSVRLHFEAARRPVPGPERPLYQQLPLGLPGIRLQHLSVRHCRACVGPPAAPLARWQRADVLARDVLLAAPGAADTQRLAYAAGWQLQLQQAHARAGSHHFALNKLFFSTAAQRLTLDSLRVFPPAAGQGKPGALRVRLQLPRLQLAGFQAVALQHGRHFRADSVLLVRPGLTFWPPARQPPPLWKVLQPVLSRSDLAQLRIADGYLRVGGLRHNPQARAVNVCSTGLRVDSSASADFGRIAYARAWTAHTGRLTGTFDAPFYQASIEHLRANTDQKSLNLTGLHLKPAFSAAQMNRRKGYQVSQVTVRLPALAFEELNYPLLAHKSHLEIGHLTAPNPRMLVASDGRGLLSPHRSVLTPEAISRIGIELTVKKFTVRNGQVTARYRSPKSPVVGTFRVSQLTGTLHNFSNAPARVHVPLTVQATAVVQGRSRLRTRLQAALDDPQGRHRIWGSFGPAPFTILNSMTTPTRLVRFDKGQVQRIDFDMHVNQQQVDGTMHLSYNDLKLSLLAYKNGELKQPLLTKIGSGLANALVIRDQNPRPGSRFVVGQTRSRRDLRSSALSLWRQGLVSGLLHSVGLPQPLAQKFSQGTDKAALPGAEE